MSSIENARNIRGSFQQTLVKKGFTYLHAERLTGIEIVDFTKNTPRALLPYGIIDPGRMTSDEFNKLLEDFPDLIPDFQKYRQGLSEGRFRIASTSTELVPIDADEIYAVLSMMFQKKPGKFEIR